MTMTTISVYAPKKKTGIIESSIWKIPETLVGPITLTAVLPLAELQDTSNQIIFEGFVSKDNIVWDLFYGFTWVGGNYVDRGGHILKGPGVTFDPSVFKGQWIKIRVTLNKQMTIGVDIDN